MKIIRYLYESIARVDCSCCMESHTIKFDLCKDFNSSEDDDALYISIKDDDRRLKDRIKNSFHFIKNWKKYSSGEYMTSHGVLIKPEQLKELYDVLKEKLIEYNIFTNDDILIIEKEYNPNDDIKFPIKWISKNNKITRNNDFTWVLYDDGEFVISTDITYEDGERKFMDNDILFGYKLHKNVTKKDIRRWAFYHILYNSKTFIGGEWEGFITKSNTIKMMSVFYYLLHNLK